MGEKKYLQIVSLVWRKFYLFYKEEFWISIFLILVERNLLKNNEQNFVGKIKTFQVHITFTEDENK